MARNQEEEPLSTQVIPENFVDTGRCFNGTFRTRNLVEGVVVAALPAYVIYHSTMSYENKIIVGVVCVGLIMLLFLTGINGDSVFEFLAHAIVYNKMKRVAKYNPRVKMEATPEYLVNNQSELPRDKIIRMVNEFRNRDTSKNEEAVSRDIYDPMYVAFFADDLGYVDTPDDLKSKKQLRQEAKERKRAEKHEKKKAKLEAKIASQEMERQRKAELDELCKQEKLNKQAIKQEKARLKKEERNGKDGDSNT